MMHQPEPWLMLVALLLYLFDSVLLLERDQALVTLGPKGWRARFGMRDWTIAGKEPLIPNPLTGYRAAYLVRWDLYSDSGKSPAPARRLDESKQFQMLSACVMVSTVCLFILLPLGLFTRAGSVLTLLAALLITLNNLIALLVLFRRRKAFGVDLRHFATLATECLLCPPFSLNLVRKVCALQQVDERLESIAERLFVPPEKTRMRAECLARIDDALLSLPEAAPEEEALRQSRARMQPEEIVHEH